MTILQRYYGNYGGMYAPEALVAPLQEVAVAFDKAIQDPAFKTELTELLLHYAGRPTPLTFAKRLSTLCQREVYLKREDLLHGGAHKTNNTLGQGLLAKYMRKKRLIAETGAGQHGVATAMIGALLNLPVDIYMGSVDVARQASNVARMKLFGATVHAVSSGSQTLKDAINEALRDWVTNIDDTYYIFGTAAGPYPFPSMVAYFQRVIGDEARAQMLSQVGALPDAVFACVGGGSNAIGMFQAFLEDTSVALYGAEADGEGIDTAHHAATMQLGSVGVFHGMKSKFVQNPEGQIQETHSISAGLDYPGVGPQHVALQESKRVTYYGVTDVEAIAAFECIAKHEGIVAAFESCHALALMLREAKTYPSCARLLVNISGRGDKDMDQYLAYKAAL